MRTLHTLLLTVLVGTPAVAADLGLVTIDADFPGGNVDVGRIDAGVVEFAPDLRGDRPWFYWYFEATAVRPGRVTFVTPKKVIGFENGGIGPQGPAVSRDGGRTWDWTGAEAKVDNTFAVDFTRPGERVRLAVTIPYVESDLKRFLAAHEDDPHLHASVLTKSRDGRDVELLRIGEVGDAREPILVTVRHHAAETIASHVVEGLLAEALADSGTGRAFREKYQLYCVPFVDKDGVERGDQGKNRKPHDHNRDYGPQPVYPEVAAIQRLHRETSFRLALDVHCPTLVMKDHQVMYFVGAKAHPPRNHEHVSLFAERIANGLPEGAPHGPLNWLRDEEKPSPKCSRWFAFQPGVRMSATLEIPFAPPGRRMDPASCRAYGRVILRALVETEFRDGDG